jgi:hypothetical protein
VASFIKQKVASSSAPFVQQTQPISGPTCPLLRRLQIVVIPLLFLTNLKVFQNTGTYY